MRGSGHRIAELRGTILGDFAGRAGIQVCDGIRASDVRNERRRRDGRKIIDVDAADVVRAVAQQPMRTRAHGFVNAATGPVDGGRAKYERSPRANLYGLLFFDSQAFPIIARRREEMGLVDYLGSLQEFRTGLDDHAELLEMSQFLLEYPFAERLFPNALVAVAHLATLGRPVVLSDGDIVFQPRKIQRSGIWAAVEGRVLVYVHKEKVLDHVQRLYPAKHYVMVDDKSNLLAAMKAVMGQTLTTVFVRQGHYALDEKIVASCPPADVTLERIGDLLTHDLAGLEAAGMKNSGPLK